MTDFLVKLFIKEYKNTEDETVRGRYGIFAGVLGIICNVFLCLLKITIGLVTGLAAVMADGFNNLSDAVSSAIGIVGVKLSEKPADEEHPFGHGRFEYIAALVVTFLILEVAISCFKSSLDKIINPQNVNISAVTAIILGISILVKIWLSVMNNKLGKRINSKLLLATSKDALGDVFITATTVISLIIYLVWGVNLDGYVGCAVAVFIFVAGIKLARDTIEPLLGEAVDKDLYGEISRFVENYEGIEGTHDLIVHSYGPSKKMATIHAELANSMDMETAHNIVDKIEQDIMEKKKIFLVVHMDPVDVGNEAIGECKTILRKKLAEMEPNASLHDMRMVNMENSARLIFDLVVPFSYKDAQRKMLTEALKAEAKKIDAKYECVITVENSYVSSK